MIVVVAEMFHISQCINEPLGASGSCIIRARLCAILGISLMLSGGLIFAPWQVNCFGICPFGLKAGLVSFMLAATHGPIHLACFGVIKLGQCHNGHEE